MVLPVEGTPLLYCSQQLGASAIRRIGEDSGAGCHMAIPSAGSLMGDCLGVGYNTGYAFRWLVISKESTVMGSIQSQRGLPVKK